MKTSILPDDELHMLWQVTYWWGLIFSYLVILTFRHPASCILGQAFHYSPENAFYMFNQQIYFII